jgi:hypothetical protein
LSSVWYLGWNFQREPCEIDGKTCIYPLARECPISTRLNLKDLKKCQVYQQEMMIQRSNPILYKTILSEYNLSKLGIFFREMNHKLV